MKRIVRLKFVLLFLCLSVFLSCETMDTAGLVQVGADILTGSLPGASGQPTDMQVGSALKQALGQGIEKGTKSLSNPGAFLKNEAIKIIFPKELLKVESTLRGLGMGNLCDQFVVSLNSAAENAASEALPIFASAISQMTFSDVTSLLFGPKDAATQFLKNKTEKVLFNKFKPEIITSLNKVNATKYWSDIANTYNSIPLMKPVSSDLSGYVTQKALDGLFLAVKSEESNIRNNPINRTTQLMKSVFGYADSKK